MLFCLRVSIAEKYKKICRISIEEKLRKRVEELTQEEIAIIPYDLRWQTMFKDEATFLRKILTHNLIKRIEHFGSTAVPGLSAKPIVDILVEITSLTETKKKIVPLLEAEGYEYFWRPVIGDQPSPCNNFI